MKTHRDLNFYHSFSQRLGRWFTAVIGCLMLAGCENLITRVEPWERGNLAKGVMVREASVHQSSLEDHVYASKEGTMGGYGVGGGGCGCN